jgi:hypothetical protein
MVNKMPLSCPSCNGTLYVSELKCPDCSTAVRGEYHPSQLGSLNDEQIEFAKTFILSRGSIREVESRLGISYPTVRNKLDEVIQALSEQQTKKMSPAEILDALEAGKITAQQAAEMLASNNKGE